MKITNAAVQMQSGYRSQTRHVRAESLRVSVRNSAPEDLNMARRASAETELDTATIRTKSVKQPLDTETGTSVMDEFQLELLKLVVERFTGKKLNFVSPRELQARLEDIHSGPDAIPESAASMQRGSRDIEFSYEYYESHYESESVSFTADGVVQTEDGRTIEMSVRLNLSREFLREQHVRLSVGDVERKLKDPLVVNFAAASTALTHTRFEFDLDVDGRADQIAFVRPGSGFLALDKNADGVINDGSELFGPATGHGFGELAAYDDDKNGFIDENDMVYDKLRVWTKDAAGRDTLMGLGQADVGAIHLGHLTTPLGIYDDRNTLAGQLRATGFFLHEDGLPGTVQELDLVG